MITMNHNAWKTTGLIATVVIVLTIPLSLLLNRNAGQTKENVATFTGGKACISHFISA